MTDDIVLPSASLNGQSSPTASAGGRCLPATSTSGLPRRLYQPCASSAWIPSPVIREAGLDPRLFDDGANVIPHAALGRLFALSVTRTNCPQFGFLVGRRATILSLRMVGRLMQHSETVGDAMCALVSNLSIQKSKYALANHSWAA